MPISLLESFVSQFLPILAKIFVGLGHLVADLSLFYKRHTKFQHHYLVRLFLDIFQLRQDIYVLRCVDLDSQT